MAKNLKYSLITLFLIFISFCTFSQTEKATVIIAVKVVDLRSNDGKVGLTLFNAEEGFPSTPENAIQKRYVDISNNTAEATFENVPEGKYAIAAYHDEDEDGEIETNWIGIPKEGTGSSNNPKSRMGPPRYEDCEFDTRQTKEILIKMKYF
jgi:uncharacterized protein (DUF2141 family)